MAKQILICGCSYVAGAGLPGGSNSIGNWTNLLGSTIGNCTVDNRSKIGANNEWIFLESMAAITTEKWYDAIIVCWSAIPRFNFPIGLELYSVDSMLTNQDVSVVGHRTVSGKTIGKIGDQLRAWSNDHWEILKLVKYVNALVKYCAAINQKVFFVNSLCPWSTGFFNQKSFSLPSDLDQYTYKLLSANERDDQEVLLLYNKVHNDYKSYGGIQEHLWLNLYESLQSTQIDVISESDSHPGIRSHRLFAERLYLTLKEKLS